MGYKGHLYGEYVENIPQGAAVRIECARMWVARWFAAAVVALVGFACIAVAMWTLVSRDWHPTRGLGSDDSKRIGAATVYVESCEKSLGRIPTVQEFAEWSRNAPTELRLDGIGFTYTTSGSADGATYAFQWYGGRGTWLSWSSNTSNPQLADISPSTYFIFGHKLLDIVIFFGLGALAFVFAGWMVRDKRAEDVGLLTAPAINSQP